MLSLCPLVVSFECYSSSEEYQVRHYDDLEIVMSGWTWAEVLPCYTTKELSVKMKAEHKASRLERLEKQEEARRMRNPHKVMRERKSYQDYLEGL